MLHHPPPPHNNNTAAAAAAAALTLSSMDVPALRKVLSEVRDAWAAHSPDSPFYMSALLPKRNNATAETVATQYVIAQHSKKRHSQKHNKQEY